jgi:D-allose transport system substrate-binding protein
MRMLTCFAVACLYFQIVLPCYAAEEYVFILRARGNPYWNLVAEGVRDAAAERKISAVVYQMESEASSEEQLNICFTAVERKPKFIAVAAANVASGIQCVRRAAERKIRVAELDSTIPVEEAKRAGVDLAFSIGSGNFKIGQRAAELAGNLLQGTDAQVLVLEGAAGNDASLKRVGGFVEQLRQIAPQAKITASIAADWDRLKALSTVSSVLEREPNLALIYAANDMMALGAAEALKLADKTGKIAIIGVDGVADARKAVLEGKLTATVAQLPYLIGYRAVQLATAETSGFVREDVPTPVLTREVLKEQTEPLLRYVR